MYEVFWTNKGHSAEPRFDTLDQAIEYGSAKNQDFAVCKGIGEDRNIVVSWRTIGGLKWYDAAERDNQLVA